MTGEVTSGIRTLLTMPSMLRAPTPAATIVAPMSPPIRAWLLELGMPRRHVIRFQAIAPISAAPTTAWVVVDSSTMPAPIVLATAVPANAPMKLNAAAMSDRVRGAQSPRRHRRGDRVGRVVEAVDVVERERQDDDDEEGHVHGRKRYRRRWWSRMAPVC